jgi:predicted nuclease of predicted toxin-antitoxin system
VKWLIDAQLPRALAQWLREKGHDAVHVVGLGLAEELDRGLWHYALQEGRIVVSKDEDFFILATRPHDKGRLLWIRLGNLRTQALITQLEKALPTIEGFFEEGQRIVEIR